MIPLVGGTHRRDLMRMNNFVKVSQFDLTSKKGRSPQTKVREVRFVTRSSNFLDLERNVR